VNDKHSARPRAAARSTGVPPLRGARPRLTDGGRATPVNRAPGPPPAAPRMPNRAPLPAGDVPLLTHDETGAASVARAHGAAGGVAVAQRPATARSAAPPLPEPGAGGAQRTPLRRRLRIALFSLLGVAVLGPVLAFVVGWMLFAVPTADDASITQVATFTFAGGEDLAVVRPENVNRVKITLDRVPEHVRKAVLAAEDSTFYTNPGFDISGIGRAIYNQATGGVGGGSTITQQYIKVTTDEREPTLWRKYKEIVLAVKISKVMPKDQILENYLNSIYFGRGAYGIQAAAKAYFDKDVGQLTVPEGAMLAGIIQSPSSWDPAKDRAGSERRWTFVVDQMVEKGWLDPAARSQQVFPANWLPKPPELGGVPDDDRYHLYNRARVELEAAGISEDQINTEGLVVTTTVDAGEQRKAVAAVKKILRNQPPNLRTALVSVDPKTGAILAYYGGSKGLGTDYAMALRQPGSTFKPFVLAAALQGGRDQFGRPIGLGSVYNGESGQIFDGRPISNSEGFDCSECDLKTAMTKSINTVFYRLAEDAGLSNVIDAAHRAGIPSNLLPEVRGGIALGDQEVHPVDMASAYATFAADGQYHQPYIVAKVVAADGRVLIDHTADAATSGSQAMPAQVARNVTESMLGVAASSNIQLADGRTVAVKTGTVQLPGRDKQNKDAWTVGYTPSISTAVWIGSDASDALLDGARRPIFGRTVPGSIWKEYMSSAVRGSTPEPFSPFQPIGTPPQAVNSDESCGDSSNSDDGDDSDSDTQDCSDSDKSDDDDKDKKDSNDKKKDKDEKNDSDKGSGAADRLFNLTDGG
jgi:membrane peptidoglycan carboxypeptidase